MITTKRNSMILGLLLAALSFSACGNDDDDGPSGVADAGIGADAAVEYVCDPVGGNADQGGLFNAALGDDVEVIVKQPSHPGFPGPVDLP